MKYSKAEAKDYAKEKLVGIFSAFCVPDTPDGEIDEAGLRRDIRYYIDVIRVGGLYVHGFYGNFWLLTTDERKRVMEIVADEARGAVPIVCRCAHQSMKETIGLIQHAEAHGADFISLIGPAFGSASESMIFEYFEHVADSTNLGLSIFNTAQAGYVIRPEVMARLATIPNVAALKNAVDMAHTIRVRELAGDQIVVVDPSEENFLISLLQFGQKAIYTGTNYMYDSARATPMRDYAHAALAGEAAKAVKLYYQMQPLRDLHTKWVRTPWDQDRLCPVATIKHWTQQLGLTGGTTRPPLQQISPEAAAHLRAEMEGVGLVGTQEPATVTAA
jgi:4-hydroxy-tetrahydrodipicolinate synthase